MRPQARGATVACNRADAIAGIPPSHSLLLPRSGAPRTLPERSGRLPAKIVDDFADRPIIFDHTAAARQISGEPEMALTLQNETAVFFPNYVSDKQISKKKCCGGAW